MGHQTWNTIVFVPLALAFPFPIRQAGQILKTRRIIEMNACVLRKQTLMAMKNTQLSDYNRVTDGSILMTADRCETMSDNALLEAVADGNRDAFAVLMKRYLAKMVMLANRVVFDREQAHEIVQEAFLRVWKFAAKWNPDGSATFLTWLRRIVINLSISSRRRYREQVALDAVEEMPTGLADGFDHIAISDRQRIVHEALETLPERQRAAVALYYFDDLSQIEAAEIMQMTPKAFDSLIVRARSNLKKHFADFGLCPQEDLL